MDRYHTASVSAPRLSGAAARKKKIEEKNLKMIYGGEFIHFSCVAESFK